VAGWLAGLNAVFYAVLAVVTAHLFWQAARVNTDDAADCLATFKSNLWTGLLVLAALFLG